jgi:hypothetical protein
MFSAMNFPAVLAALAWWVPSVAFAQPSNGRVVKFRVLCYEHAKDTLGGKVLSESGNPVDVDFYIGGFGPQVSGRFTDGKARFFTETPGPDGKPQRTVIAEGNLVDSASQMFLLFPETKEQGPIYRIHAFDDLERAFPMGATRVINLAAQPVRFTFAGALTPPIKPGGMQIFPQVKAVDEWNMFTTHIELGLDDGKWVPIATQSWKSSDRKRDWVITYVDPLTRQPAIRLYQDIPPWRETVLVPPDQ